MITISRKSNKKKLHQIEILWDEMVILTFHLGVRLVLIEMKLLIYDQFQFT